MTSSHRTIRFLLSVWDLSLWWHLLVTCFHGSPSPHQALLLLCGQYEVIFGRSSSSSSQKYCSSCFFMDDLLFIIMFLVRVRGAFNVAVMEVNVNYTITYCAKIMCGTEVYDAFEYITMANMDTPCCQSSSFITAEQKSTRSEKNALLKLCSLAAGEKKLSAALKFY